MVEIRVAVADPALVHALMLRLRRLFGASSVTYDRANDQVCVCSEWESRAVALVVELVQDWLEDADAAAADLAVGERHYTLVATGSGRS